MAAKSKSSRIDPPSSDPAPVRESQPQSQSPGITAQGTERHHALFDTPPEGTQPLELERSVRPRVKSTRLLNSLEYQSRDKRSFAKSNAPASQSNTARPSANARASQPDSSAQRGTRPAKRARLRFDGEDSSDNGSRDVRPRKTRNTSTTEHSPPPKPPGRGSAVAQRSSPIERSVTLAPSVARELESLIGLNMSTATAKSVREQAAALSNPNPPPMGSALRYSQVEHQASPPVSLLKKKGTYQRNQLKALAHPKLSQNQEHKSLHAGLKPSKHHQANTSAGSDRYTPTPTIRSPPPLPSFLQYPQTPPSASSTQRAVVQAFGTQPHGLGTHTFQPSPIPEPRSQIDSAQPTAQRTQSLSHQLERELTRLERRPSSDESRSSTLDARSPIPHHQPATPSFIPRNSESCPVISGLNQLQPANARQQAAPTPISRTARPLAPDPNSATDSETESEPELKPKPNRKHGHRARQSTRPDNPNVEPSAHLDGRRPSPPNAYSRNADRALPASRTNLETLLRHMNSTLGGINADYADLDMDTLMDLVAEVSHEHRQPIPTTSSSRAGPGLASWQNLPNLSASQSQHRGHQRTEQPGPNEQAEDNADDESSADEEFDPIDREKSGLGRYPGLRGKVASRAMPKLLSMSVRKGVYQDHDTNIRWARNAYRRAWKEHCPHVSYKECPKDLLQTIITRISNLRTLVKERIRKVVRFLYGFNSSSKREPVKAANRLLAARLGHNTFHCLKLKAGRRQYENLVFKEGIYEGFFWSPDSFLIPDCPSMKEKEGLPLPAVAFVLTMMQECIEEWTTGRFHPRDLNLSTQRSRFDAHLQGLINYRLGASQRMATFQQDWLDGGLEHSGIQCNDEEQDDHYCQSVTRVEDVRPDTPSSPEPEYNEDGRFATQSKGKGKACHN